MTAGHSAHHGFTPEAAPVLKPQDAPTRLVTHSTLGTDRQVAFQPLMGHGDLQRKHTHTHTHPHNHTHKHKHSENRK